MLTKDQLRAQLKGEHPKLSEEELSALVEVEHLRLFEHENLIRGVEIFSAGTHNGDTYTEQDIDDMIAAFGELSADYKPALKVGHVKDKPGAPAYGYVENLRRVGSKLVADFSSMHDTVVEAIRKRAYDRVSSEIYFNFKRGAKVYRRALKAVALLGAEVPAVANLVPLHKVQFSDEAAEAVFSAGEGQLSVPNEALVAALSERVTALTTMMKEFLDMKTAAQVKEELKKLHERLDSLKKDGEADKHKEEIATLAADIERLGADLKVAEHAEAVGEENKALKARLERLEKDRREREVKDRVATLSVPAFAPALTALFAYAAEHEDVKVAVFSKKDGKEVKEEKSLGEIGDSIVAEINAQAARLFKVYDDKGGRRTLPEGQIEGDPSKEVDRLAREHLAKNPALKGDYAAAVEAVCDLNPELARAYAEQQSGRSA